MLIGRIQGTTRVCGREQGYRGLPLRDTAAETPDGTSLPAMETAWLPTPDELKALVRGAPVILTVLGNVHPPCKVEVGEAPDAN